MTKKTRRGRPRLEPAPTPLELLEAFCCTQLVRVEQTLNHRYSMDGVETGQDNKAEPGQFRPGAGIRQVRRNDHMARYTIERDCTIERRK